MNEEEVKMLLERVIALCVKIEKFYDSPDELESDPVKVLELIVNDAVSVRVDSGDMLRGDLGNDD
jgi:hypothetical protein